MTPQELKNSILQLAIQGRLVEQRPEEGTAEELYQEIQKEKRRLIKEGKIKKEKPLPEITEDEKPFEIPESWKWVKLGSIVKKLTDGSHNPPPNTGEGYPVISAKNVKNGLVTFENVDRYTDENGFKKENPRTNITKGDVILGIIGGSIGNVAIYTHEVKVIAQRSIAIMTTMIDSAYFVNVLKSPLIQNGMHSAAAGSAQGGVYLGTLSNFPLPVPPLAEQRRIVAKIEEISPYADRYEQVWNRLEELNKRFPADMQKSLLKLAIEGKLVEQRPEEGTSEELWQKIQAEKQQLIKKGKIKKGKPLPEITEDEKPFEIPESWKWVRLAHLARITGGFAFKSTNYTDDGIRVIRISDFNEFGFINNRIVRHPYYDSLLPYVLEEKNILLCMTGGTVGKSFFVKGLNEKMVVNQRVATIKIDNAMPEYVNYVILSPITQAVIQHTKNSTNDNISIETIQNFLVPLPPLAEQKRIVARLDELLPLCEKLK